MTTHVETTLAGVQRLPFSVNGNARFQLFTTSGMFITQSDSACAYDVENIARSIPSEGIPIVLTLSRAGRVMTINYTGPTYMEYED